MSTTYEETRLPPTLTLRPVKWTDLEQVAQLIYDVCEADGDATVAVTPEDLRLEWLTPGFNLETDAYLVETEDGHIVGFEEFNNHHEHTILETDGYVHPKFTGLGIGTTMLRAIEARARKEMILAEQDVRVSLRSTIDNRDQASHDLHKNEGYQPVRYHWRMEINLKASPAVPALPQGIELRPFNKDEHARAVLDAQNDAFRDQWGNHAMEFEGWSLRKFGHKDFDPSLWLIAWDGDQIAGFSQNRFRMGIGWVGTLGVRSTWRKRGLGEALLLHSFGNFYQRGVKTIGLGVDASNPTGATRLYQKVGMHIASQFLTYEKELRAGRELEEQEEKTMKTQLHEELISFLPDGLEDFTVRGATMEDVEPALDLYNRWAQSVIHENEITDIEAVRNEWVSPGFDPADDIHLVFAPDREMVGYIEVWTTAKPPIHPWIWGRVDPRYEGLGIGTYLLTWAEARAKTALDEVPAEFRFAPRVKTFQQADGSKKLFEDMGYQRIRSSYNMRINMDAPPSAPVWPDGITLKIYNPETDLEAVYRADIEAFRDHFGYVEEPFEQGLERFKHFMTGYEGFDPSLWFLAMDGEEIAGVCLCRKEAYDNPEVGFVNTLGVRRPWRKRGIGLALLLQAFGEFYRRGQRKAGLGVDAENLTGALRLYENAGMHIHQASDIFEKEIRPGKEISVQSL